MTVAESARLMTFAEVARHLAASEWSARAMVRSPERRARLVREFGRVLVPDDLFRELAAALAPRRGAPA